MQKKMQNSQNLSQAESDKTRKKYDLVILHGWMQDSSHWQGMLQKFETDKGTIFNEIVILDLPGFGGQPQLDLNAGVPEYANWVDAEISKRKLKDVLILGHSFGGRIACEIAYKNPDWLESVVLFGAPVIYRPSKKLQFKIMINKFAGKFIPQDFKNEIIKKVSKNEDIEQVVGTSLEKTFRKSIVFDQTEKFKKINLKFLVLAGDQDPEVRADMLSEMEKLNSYAQIVVLPKLGHNIHLQNPNLLYGTIKEFIKNL